MAPFPRLRLLGGASIEGADGPIGGRAAQRHRLALLALLAVEERGVSRDRAIALLWPERSEAKGRHALSDSVYRINRALDGDAVVAVGDRELRLDPEVLGSDVATFRAALAAEDWDAAVRAYDGPFLDGFHLAGSVEFDHWMDPIRQDLQRRYGNALEALADERAARGDHAGRVAAWTLRAAVDPYDSRVVVQLMRALEARGNPAAALQQADEHVELLARELGASAPPEVEAEARRIRSGERRETGAASSSARTAGAPTTAAPPPDPEEPATSPIGAAAASISSSPTVTRGPGPKDVRGGWAFAGVGVLSAVALTAAVLSGPGTAVRPGSTAETDASIPSLAILAFDDLGASEASSWIGDGTAEEIAFALGRVEDLTVVSTHSSFAIGRELSDVRQIADTLGTKWILDGTVRHHSDSLWVAVSLVDGVSGHRAWGETFTAGSAPGERQALHHRIAEEVATSLSRAVPDRIGGGGVVPDDDTYEDYFEARFRIRQAQSGTVARMDEGIPSAVALLEHVVERAPRWADGWASLGEAYHWSAFAGLDDGGHWSEAARALERALELDPDHPQAHASMGYVLIRLSRDAEKAEWHFQRALELDGDQYWHCGYPNFLFWVGRYDEAVDATRRAEGADPMYSSITSLRATAHLCAGDLEGTILHARRALAKQPGAPVPLRDLALALGGTGRVADALNLLESSPASDGYPSLVKALLLARDGQRDRARATLSGVDLEKARRLEAGYVSDRLKVATLRAAVLVALDRREEAIGFLESAVDRDPDTLLYDRCFPELQLLEDDPRYRELLRRTGIPGW